MKRLASIAVWATVLLFASVAVDAGQVDLSAEQRRWLAAHADLVVGFPKDQPPAAVIDVGMPGKSGIDATAGIRRCSPETRVVALSMFGDPHYRQRMMNAGASAYVLKSEAGVDLIAAIQAVQRGERFTSPSPGSSRTAVGAEPPIGSGAERCAAVDRARLTPREQDILRLLACGQRTKDIARQLEISPKTVETHRSRIMLKLDIDNLAGLVHFAIRAGIVSTDGI